MQIETLPELEVIGLISNNNFKDYFKEISLQQFYAMSQFSKKHAREVLKWCQYIAQHTYGSKSFQK